MLLTAIPIKPFNYFSVFGIFERQHYGVSSLVFDDLWRITQRREEKKAKKSLWLQLPLPIYRMQWEGKPLVQCFRRIIFTWFLSNNEENLGSYLKF